MDFFGDGFYVSGDDVGESGFEIAIAFASEGFLDYFHGLTGHLMVDGHEVGDRWFVDGVELYARFGVGDGFHDLLADGVGVVGEKDFAKPRSITFAHLFARILQAHDACALFLEIDLRKCERGAEVFVEAFGEIASKFDVLGLIVADGHDRRIIEQDIGGHEHGVAEEAEADFVAVFFGFVFVLCHAFHLTHLGDGREHPGQLGMFADLALDVDD